MSNNPEQQTPGGFFRPLTDAEKANLTQGLRYALAIFAAVAIALIIVGIGSRIIGV